MGLRELLIPQDKIFFDLFEQQAGIVKEAAWQLVALTEDFTNVKEKRHAIWLLESKGDQVTHAINGAIIGVGATRGRNAVQWKVVREMMTAWIITIPLAVTVAWVGYFVTSFALTVV